MGRAVRLVSLDLEVGVGTVPEIGLEFLLRHDLVCPHKSRASASSRYAALSLHAGVHVDAAVRLAADLAAAKAALMVETRRRHEAAVAVPPPLPPPRPQRGRGARGE